MAGKEGDGRGSGGFYIEEAKRIIDEQGFSIDVEGATAGIEEEKSWNFNRTRKDLLVELGSLPVEDVLTSELVQMCTISTDGKYGRELEYRLSLLGLNAEQKKKFIAQDLEALSKKDQELVRAGKASKHFNMGSIDTLPSVDPLTMSDLISVIDIANWAWETQHEWVSDACINAIVASMSADGPFNKEFERRSDLMGLEKWQRKSFIKNECLILSRATWGYKPQEKSWTPESIVR